LYYDYQKGKAMSDFGDGLSWFFSAMTWALALALPLAVWKVIDILLWIFTHLKINWI
jgi:hypothetical protein